MERIISEKQEKVYRLVAGEFEGLSTKEAAGRLGVGQRAVQSMLKRIEEKAPQLFPLITKQEYHVLQLLQNGATNSEITEALGLSACRVSQIKKSLIAKKRWKDMPTPKTLRLTDGMEGHVKEVF